MDGTCPTRTFTLDRVCCIERFSVLRILSERSHMRPPKPFSTANPTIGFSCNCTPSWAVLLSVGRYSLDLSVSETLDSPKIQSRQKLVRLNQILVVNFEKYYPSKGSGLKLLQPKLYHGLIARSNSLMPESGCRFESQHLPSEVE